MTVLSIKKNKQKTKNIFKNKLQLTTAHLVERGHQTKKERQMVAAI